MQVLFCEGEKMVHSVIISSKIYQEVELLYSFKLQQIEARLFPLAKISIVFRWSLAAEREQYKFKGKIPRPFFMVHLLVTKYLQNFHSKKSILDIGCETGKNALCLIRGGHKVVLLDVAPAAITFTLNNLKKLQMNPGVAGTIFGKIENLRLNQGPFKAVVGTYAFSFIPPQLFQKVMQLNVLRRIEPGGFFAGGFFGLEHGWRKNPHLTFVNMTWLKKFFKSQHFSILVMREMKAKNSNDPSILFHTIEVIARRMF